MQSARGGANDCLSDETIAMLLEQRLDHVATRVAVAHIEECEACMHLLLEAGRVLESHGPSLPSSSGSARPAASGERTIRDSPQADSSRRPARLSPGAVAGRYVILDCIGEGGMGVVYLARDPYLGRKVALKLVRPDPGGASTSGRARLLREAQATASLSHSNVITVYDVGTIGDDVFLAMELIEGGTLREWLRNPRSWREVAGKMCHAGEGLAAAHAAGLVHRDFKPDNVLVGTDGRVRVTDFGLARAVAESGSGAELAETRPLELATSMTSTGALVGTPAYMAPEQISGTVADARSDLFSFCVTFYEGLYGERPFRGSTLIELRDAILRGRTTPARSSAGVPKWLRLAILRGLSADPDARPPSVRALIDGIDRRLSRGRMGIAIVQLASILAVTTSLSFGVIQARSCARAATPASNPTEIPASTNPEALRLYESGRQKLREGSPESSAGDLLRAAEIDPTFAAAHLRYALLRFQALPVEAREHLARAVVERLRLSESDRMLLVAAQAWMQSDPPNTPGFVQKMDKVHARYPDDAELARWAAAAHSENGDREGALRLFDRVLARDPGFGEAYMDKAEELAYAGDVQGALKVLELCAVRVPNATLCPIIRNYVDGAEGNCQRVEETSKQVLSRDPNSDNAPYDWLASAAYAQERPIEAVRALLRQDEQIRPPSRQRLYGLLDDWKLDVLAGDFESALRDADALEQSVAADRDAAWHSRTALLRAQALVESGRPGDAGRGIQAFLRSYVWMEGSTDDFSLSRDPTPPGLLAERRAGLLSPEKFEEQRYEWVRARMEKASGLYRPFVWLYGYAATSETAQDAEQAFVEQPRFGPIPHFQMLGMPDAYVGRVYLLAGRVSEALSLLQRAARSCLAVFFPAEHTQVHFVLGQALESLGRREEACWAYGVVLSRWGHAKPRSVTADKARSAARSLGCPTQTPPETKPPER
jgi:serine/threonine-protein kinase